MSTPAVEAESPAKDHIDALNAAESQSESMETSAARNVMENKILLSVENLTYEVGSKNNKKELLHGVNAAYSSGELVAVMGPSGAGKTTFLNVLSNAKTNQHIREGGLRLNGEELPRGYNSLCSYIPQNDVLYPALSPRQAFAYATQLRLSSSVPQKEKEGIVERLLKELHLEKCADTPVGNEHQRGVSGGEKKRASIGLELITEPAIILVDEPTSGLDSKMAEDVVAMLQTIAQQHGRLVLCTIHQPSWQMFQRFDKLTLLNHGNIVYHGAAPLVIDHFNTLNFQVPKLENPMDYYFRVLQTEDQTIFSNAWKSLTTESREKYATGIGTKEDYVSGSELVAGWSSNGNSWFHQFFYLFLRASQDAVRDREKFVQGLMVKFATGLLLGVVFFGQADGSSESVFTAQSSLFFIIFSANFDTTMKSLLEYPQIKPLVVREYRNGAFDIFPYFMAQLVCSSIFDSFASLFYMSAYFMIGLSTDVDKILSFVGIIFFLTVIGVEMGLLIGANTADMKEAQGYFIPIIMPQLLFAGFLIPPSQIPSHFKWIYHISYFQYGLSTAIINEFEDFSNDCVFNGTSTSSSQIPCYATGEQVLDLSDLDADDKGRNLLIMLGFVVGLIPISFFFVRRAIIKGAANV